MQRPRGDAQKCASFFGVGAPEAVVVGLVAVVIFGPQGLAEAAKSLGKTVRAIKPDLDEFMNTATELKSQVDESLGIDEIKRSFQTTGRSFTDLGTTAVSSTRSSATASGDTASSSSNEASTSGTFFDEDPDIEAKRFAAANMAWGQPAAPASQDRSTAADGSAGLDALSLDELQAELQRRKASKSSIDA